MPSTPPFPSTALVTGAASGIGRALAGRLVGQGVEVTLVDIDRAAVEAAAASLGAARAATVDVADAAAVDHLADEVGAVDLLCLNAGVVGTEMGAPWEATPEEWTRVLGVNLHGVVNGLRSFVPRLLERDRPAQIIVTASLAGALTWPTGGAYAASKHAVLVVAEQAAQHLADTPVTITAVCPALVRTAMSDVGDDPDDVAADALAAAAAGRFAVIPAGWSTALRERADTLASGRLPTAPLPDQQ